MPLLDTLSKQLESLTAERGGVLGVLPGLVADDSPDWIRVADLVREPYDGLRAFVEETAGRWGAAPHVGAALLWKTYSYWQTLPLVLGWALGRRVPLMRFDDTVVRSSAAGVTVAATEVTVAVLPDDPLAGAPGAVVVEDLAAAIRESLMDGQLPLIRALNALTKVGERTLWGSTAEAVVHPLTLLGSYGEARRLLDEIGPPVAGLVVPEGDGFRRRTCCLWITIQPSDPCSTCCIKG
ncbi:hypothetical protein [Sphaerimonospora thailandensis]|uniref:Ferric iron reductase FhuF-like transporter n=1 Tax=Sphaerimonospora thailandensis TaxID=795644 RepID=A0A8J3R8X3_9ACTN|nr:hypothetical protein [Sphaerimonospora thailandensis]GIH71531.1 hypothetical protein Mth01_37840 [Sphaerimonospora thailandensis]